jgi:hypothetical protein
MYQGYGLVGTPVTLRGLAPTLRQGQHLIFSCGARAVHDHTVAEPLDPYRAQGAFGTEPTQRWPWYREFRGRHRS